MSPPEDNEASNRATEIVFFDVEITYLRSLKEFGAIIVSLRKLVEIESYGTVIRPKNLSEVPKKSPNGLTREFVAMAPLFEEVADIIFEILNDRIWAGHGIKTFDIPLIKKAFAYIGRPAPEPAGIYDTCEILKKEFGNITVDHKMQTLASYLGLGKQKHRSFDDVQMNLEIVKRWATVSFLDSTLPQMLPVKSILNSSFVTRSRVIKRSCSVEARRRSPPICPASNRLVPGGLLGKVMERAKGTLRGVQGSRPLSTLLKLSRFFMR